MDARANPVILGVLLSRKIHCQNGDRLCNASILALRINHPGGGVVHEK
jgi:hypothetical protein